MVTDKKHYWQKYGFFGGHLFLDFLNTFDDYGKTRKLDAIPDWETTLDWAKQTGILNEGMFKTLLQLSTKTIEREHRQLYEFREHGWKLFRNIAGKTNVSSADLNYLNRQIKWAYLQANLVQEDGRFDWKINATKNDLTFVRAQLGIVLADLMSTPILNRLSECNSCTGLFLNSGRGVGRKWCRMTTCGNRSKVSNFRSSR